MSISRLELPVHVTIERRHWARGTGGIRTYLFDGERYDALGYLFKATGLKDEQIKDIRGFNGLPDSVKLILPPRYTGRTKGCMSNQIREIMRINDDTEMQGNDREHQLVSAFGALHINLHFR